jgi:hypothetical protein
MNIWPFLLQMTGLNGKFICEVVISVLLLAVVRRAKALSHLIENDLDGETLLASLDADYYLAWSKKTAAMSMKEYVPQGETVEDWTEMFTIQIMYKWSSLSPTKYLALAEEDWNDKCIGADSNAKAHVTSKSPENGYPTIVFLLHCLSDPRRHWEKYTVFKAIQGQSSFYIVQKAFKSFPSEERIQHWMLKLREVTLCDPGSKSHPCPAYNVNDNAGPQLHDDDSDLLEL